jgi:hypothetical protein
MSLMDKIKSMFSGGSSDADAHDHTGHDHAGHDHSHEPVAPAAADAVPPEEGENTLD